MKWRRRNTTVIRQNRCLCGRPGVVTRGSGPAVWRFCVEHRNVPLDVPWVNGVPQWKQDRAACSWRSSSLLTGLVTACGCGEHVS